jgi:membrane-bound inhibitor of C-type lysozyme
MKHISFTLLACLVLALTSACSASRLLNPFDTGVKEQPRTPQNATLYLCEDKKQFYLRMLNNNNDAWLIYPDHEVDLSKSSSGNNRYTSGAIALELNGDQTTLTDGDTIAYKGCKAQTKK